MFELGQKNNSFIIWLIHKYLNIQSKIKVKKDNSYTTLSTKDPKIINKLIILLKGKLLGIKSFEYSIWSRAFRTNKMNKLCKAKEILNKIRKQRNSIK